MKTVKDATFDADVLKSDVPVLVDFWAEWCGPCKVMTPMLEQLEAEYAGRVVFTKVNAGEETGAASRYGIRNLPTLILFKGGEPAGMLSGGQNRNAVTSWINNLL